MAWWTASSEARRRNSMYRAISLDALLFDHPANPFEWVNEHGWQAVGQTRRYALGGNLYALESRRRGRPIELYADPQYCWIPAATVAALEAMATIPGANPILILQQESETPLVKSVIFDRAQGPFAFEPVDDFGDYFSGSLYLTEV